MKTYKNRDMADISPWFDRFKRVESHLKKEQLIDFNFQSQLFYWEDGHIYRAYIKDNTVKLDEFNYLHFQKRQLKAADKAAIESKAFFITRMGFLSKDEGVPTKQEIERLNGIRLKFEIKKRIEYYSFIWRRRVNKYLFNK